jgi:hypothetical protein
MPDALPRAGTRTICMTSFQMRAVWALFKEASDLSTVHLICDVNHSKVMQATRVGRFSKTGHGFLSLDFEPSGLLADCDMGFIREVVQRAFQMEEVAHV